MTDHPVYTQCYIQVLLHSDIHFWLVEWSCRWSEQRDDRRAQLSTKQMRSSPWWWIVCNSTDWDRFKLSTGFIPKVLIYWKSSLALRFWKELSPMFPNTRAWGPAWLRVQPSSDFSRRRQSLPAYGVGSANLSRRKIGHAHDNSADSENVAGAREPSVHGHFMFLFKNGQGNMSFSIFLPMPKTSETSQPQAQPADDWRAVDMAILRGLQRPREKFGSAAARLSRKKNGKVRGL